MKNLFIKSVKNMVSSLEQQAIEKGFNISDFCFDSAGDMLSSMDRVINDGGFVRCEYFTDLAHIVAIKYGEIESAEFEDIKWKCIELAYNVLKKKYANEYLIEPFTNEELLIVEEDGVIEAKVLVEIGEIIDNDLEGFLDLIDEKLTGGLMLQQVCHGGMVRCISSDDSIVFNASGDMSDRMEDLIEECFDFMEGI
mgnify:CR=1 FL=1